MQDGNNGGNNSSLFYMQGNMQSGTNLTDMFQNYNDLQKKHSVTNLFAPTGGLNLSNLHNN